ncbi:MAG: hypothetical protein IPL35_03820 [Sphingobacteriales bacterium]|nr:hypothetical protein [Sphingobacteriales bacterium]
MKHIFTTLFGKGGLLLGAVLLGTFFATAQIVNIPDPNFKYALLSHNPAIDTNNDDEIQVAEAEAVGTLDLNNKSISDLTGIEVFVNLEFFRCSQNNISVLDVSNLIHLKNLYCNQNSLAKLNVQNLKDLSMLDYSNNFIDSLDVHELKNLYGVVCFNNQLTYLNVSGSTKIAGLDSYQNLLTSLNVDDLISLKYFDCNGNKLTYLDVSKCKALYSFACGNNLLEILILKNGSNNFGTVFYFGSNPNLAYICCDTDQLEFVKNKAVEFGLNNCQVNTYCSFEPGGNYNTISGNIIFDNENNSCDENDVPLANQLIQVEDGAEGSYINSDNSGSYKLYCGKGTYTLLPFVENPYFSVNAATFNFTETNLTTTQNFCITANGTHHDLEITFHPLNSARPGFDAKYKIICRNKGNQKESGSIYLQFDDSVLDFVSASPALAAQSDSLLT